MSGGKTKLQVKFISLGLEARVIKRKEQKWKKVLCVFNGANDVVVSTPHPLFFDLRHHRLMEVRREARAAHLAYGYLRGYAYKRIENKCHDAPNWARVEALITKYGLGYCPSVEKRKELNASLVQWKNATSTR